MRFFLPLLALMACTGPVKEQVSVSSSDAPGPNPTGAVPIAKLPPLAPVCALSSPPPASFRDVKGWGLLSLQMSPKEAGEVFEKAGVAIKEEVTRGYFPSPEGTPRGVVSHMTEVVWRFSCGGWAGIVTINPAMTALAEIRLEGPSVSRESDALDLIRQAEAIYGAPTKIETMSYPEFSRIDRIWRNPKVEVTVGVIHFEKQEDGKAWSVFQTVAQIDPP